MANYSAIKAAVNAYIKANGKKEITGHILNSVLNATIDSLGRYFQFAGGALPTDDPGTPDQNVCYLAGEPGVYTNFGGITIENEEVALLFWNGEWTKQRVLLGIQEVEASVDNQVGTPSVDVSYSGGQLVLTFHNLKGEQGIQGIQGIQGEQGVQGIQGVKGDTGDAAGFGTIGADITGGVGTPGVSVETSGSNTAKNLMFHFTNLKGETGVTSVVATIDNTSGTPSCQVSLVNGVLTLAFSGLKGLKGDTGVSADYPITIYNGLDSDATDQALAAAQGKVLDGKISQLRQEVADLIIGPEQIDGTAQDIEVDVPLSFIDGSFKTASSSNHTISVTSNSGQSTIVIDNVSPGDVYLLKSEYGNLLPSFVGTYFIFAVDDTTSALTSTEAASFVELVDAVNYIYKIIVPNGGTKKIFSAVHISYQENVWCKKITHSKNLEWLEVTSDNLEQEVKEAIENAQNVPASNINGDEQIVSQEDMTITFTDGTFKTLPAQTRYFADYTSSGNSLVQIAVQPGDVYYYKYYQAIQQSKWNTYFLFGQTLQRSPIFREDIPDFVELIDAANFIYKVTIPEGANYFISAVDVSYKSQIWIKKIVTKKELAWLKLSSENIEQVAKTEKENDALWKLWDSIRKPIDFNGKSMVAFGDSITYGIASPGLITTQQSYIKLFAQYAGVSGLVVQAVSGSTLAQRGGGSDIYDRVLSYSTPADIIWIAGGTNDWSTGQILGTFGDSDPAKVYGALKGICEYLQTNYPNARVIFVTPIPYTLLESNWPNHITELNLYREAIYEVATYYGYDVVSGLGLGMPRTSGGWNNTMCADTDGCHPTERGHALYARSLCGKLL